MVMNMQELELLLVTKGHPFERGSFFDMFDKLGVRWTHVEQPAARVFFTPEMAHSYDVLVMYDMPGIRFGPGGVQYEEPTQAYTDGMLALLEQGKGMVFLHHAIAGWPAWEEYARIIGGRFLYQPDTLAGRKCQDSGYRHQVDHQISRLTPHPITESVPESFSMTDELYLFEVFEEDVIPLLQSNYGFSAENFYSAAKVVNEGKMFSNEGWTHPDGSNLVAWVKHYLNSPIVYLQGGDDSVAWQSSEYQQLLISAIRWAGSSSALAWARERNQRKQS